MKDLSSNKVFAGTEIGINYVTHIYTLAGAGYNDKAYEKKYLVSLNPLDLTFLRNHAELLSFWQMDHGPFASLMYFTPAYFNFSTAEHYEKYYHAWKDALEKKSFKYLKEYDRDCNNLSLLFEKENLPALTQFCEALPILLKIIAIFRDNLDYYLVNIWPEIEPKLNDQVMKINNKLKNNLIEQWEKLLKIPAPMKKYCLCLFYAGAQGPSFNNVSYEKNLIYYKHEMKFLMDMVSHEIGIHFMLNKLMPLIIDYRNEYGAVEIEGKIKDVPYLAFEALAHYYNGKILKRDTLDIFSDSETELFVDIYKGIDKKDIDLEDMYERGIQGYLARKWAGLL